MKAYFLAHHSAYNKARGDPVLLDRIEQHRFVMIEQDGVGLVGVAGTFRHGAFREAGATRITLNGFGLQKVTHYARSLHEHIVGPPPDVYYATVIDSDRRSLENMEQVGFVPWTDPDPQLVSHRTAMAEPERVVDFLRLPQARLADHARALLDLEATPVLHRPDRTRPGRLEAARLTLDLEVLSRHRDSITRFAGC